MSGKNPTDFEEVNGDLCGFSSRWTIDGDYLRCRKCKRPQITDYMDAQFPHAYGCKVAGAVEPHPWRAYLGLMARLADAARKDDHAR